MKKYFFYAAMAVATMASCTSEDDLTVDPIDPTPDAEEQVALNLGVATPSMTVGSKGTGMVGYVQGDTTGISWDSQQLFITMVNQKTDSVYYEPDGTPYFDGLTFIAPKKDGTTQNNGDLIRMYKTYYANDNNGILEYKYYPVTGNYKFYGWHVDDATGNKNAAFGQTKTESDTTAFATVSNIVINGTQDLLAANTIAIPAELGTSSETNPYYEAGRKVGNTYSDMVKNQFSARTARNNFTPILNFKHTLARLKFHVKAGKGTDAAKNYVVKDSLGRDSVVVREDYTISADSLWKSTIDRATLAGMLDGAIYVTDIKLLNANNDITLDLITQKASATAAVDTFTLMSKPQTGKTLVNLKAVAPTYAFGYNYGTDADNTEGKLSDEIGESIMYLPVTNGNTGTDKQIKIQVQLGQCLIKTEDETKGENDADKYTYYWDTPKPVVLTLDASTIKLPENAGFTEADKVFMAGRSYNIYITIYGRERIEVSANLVPWTDGGDIETDIEDGYQN